MNVDDGIRGRMARAPAIFAKGHVVAPAQIIYLKVPGNAVTIQVDFQVSDYSTIRPSGPHGESAQAIAGQEWSLSPALPFKKFR
jgi:hypothetical protein